MTQIPTKNPQTHWIGGRKITVQCEGCDEFYQDQPVIRYMYEYLLPPVARQEIAEDAEAPTPPCWVCWLQCPHCEQSEFATYSDDILDCWGPWEESGGAVGMGFDLRVGGWGETS
jgi:hypothetical protein